MDYFNKKTISTQNYEIIIPDLSNTPDQHEEWVTLDFGERKEKIRFHNYSKIYEIEGLYEKLFRDQLNCNSPQVISQMLIEAVKAEDKTSDYLKVLDFGAGNGMVAEELHQNGVKTIVGADILPEAKIAALRDRPKVYKDYYVMDFSELEVEEQRHLEKYNFNALITVAALGFGDIPPQALINAFNLVENGGWVAFNIRDKFLSSDDDSGFQEVVSWMSDEHLEIKKTKTYLHRYSMTGEELTYKAFVGKKIKDVD